MDWRQYFIDNEESEELFQAILARLNEDCANEWDRDVAIERDNETKRREAEEEEDRKYLKQEFYREQHAKKHGYAFKPKDRNGKYINPAHNLDYWRTDES